MALVDEMIEKGSEFSFKGTDDELDTRSSIETSLGYEDLGAAEQDMRIRYMPASDHGCCRKFSDLNVCIASGSSYSIVLRSAARVQPQEDWSVTSCRLGVERDQAMLLTGVLPWLCMT